MGQQAEKSTVERSRARRTGRDTRLGAIEFSDWYETPVFEPDDDERMEELATSGHGAARLMAKVVLAANARREVKRAAAEAEPADEAPADQAAVDEGPVEEAPVEAVSAEEAPVAIPDTVIPEPAPAEPAPAETAATHAAAADTAPTDASPAEVAVAEDAAEPIAPVAAAIEDTPPNGIPAVDVSPPEPAQTQDRWEAWTTSGPRLDEASFEADLERPRRVRMPKVSPRAHVPAHARRPKRAAREIVEEKPAQPPARTAQPKTRTAQPKARTGRTADKSVQPAATAVAERSWRRRTSEFLDRWAEKEVAAATRLDQVFAPAIPTLPSLPKPWARRDRNSPEPGAGE